MRLLESTKQKGRRSVGGTLFSVVFHSAIIFLVVFATGRAAMTKDENPEEKVNFVKVKTKEPPPPVKKDEPPPPKKPEPPKVKPKTPPKAPPMPKLEAAPAPPKGFEVLRAPVNVPVEIPKVDLSGPVTNEADFSGKGVAGGTAKGVEGGTGDKDSKGTEAGAVDTDKTYFEFQVEDPVQALGGAQPRYPEGLRSSGEEGEVIAEFVVNERGRFEPGSFKVLKSSNPLFTAAVRAALPNMRFRAAKIGGKSVSQVVQQPFQFKLDR